MRQLGKGKPGIRGKELLEWGEYIEQGGMIGPLSMLDDEHEKPPKVNENVPLYFPKVKQSQESKEIKSYA